VHWIVIAWSVMPFPPDDRESQPAKAVQKLAVTPGPGAPHRLYHRLDYTVKWRPGTPPLAHRGSFAGAPRLAR